MIPVEAYRRLLRKPTLWVQEFDEVFVPLSDKAVVETVGQRVENITCCIRRFVSTTGDAIWSGVGAPCGAVVRSWESYRRHVITGHLGCKRPTGGLTLKHSIREFCSAASQLLPLTRPTEAQLFAADPPRRKSLKRKRVASDEDIDNDIESDSECESRSEGEDDEV